MRPGDTLVVWKLDRLGRSLRHLVDTVTGLAECGIWFHSLREAIDTTTPGGKRVFHVFAASQRADGLPVRQPSSACSTITVAITSVETDRVAAALGHQVGKKGVHRPVWDQLAAPARRVQLVIGLVIGWVGAGDMPGGRPSADS